MVLKVLRFDNSGTRAKTDKLAPIRDVCERLVQYPSTDVQPRAEVTADEHFVPFMEKCNIIWQHNTSQPGKKDTEIHA